MKLIFCPECKDVVRLRNAEMRYCSCGKSGGMYIDKQQAMIEGKAVPIGISNESLVKATALQEGCNHPVRIIAFTIPIESNKHIIKKLECQKCRRHEHYHLTPVDHPENSIDHEYSYSSQSYKVYKCDICGEYWGCRHQWDAGSGSDDRWKAFGKDPNNVRRHC